MAKQKKFTLDIDDDLEFDVFGISTPFADYRLAWELNDKFELKFEKSTQTIHIFDRRTKKNNQFQQFSYVDEENLTEFHLLKNKQGNQIVTQDHAVMDYFLILKNNFSIDTNKFLSRIRNTNGIVAVFKLESDNFDFIQELY
jgi:hypothetical protein